MSRQCDICSNMLKDKSHGIHYDQNRVLTSPSFWLFLFTKGTMWGILDNEQKLGSFFKSAVHSDPDGYIVCKECSDKLSLDAQLVKEHNLIGWCNSIPSGRVDESTIATVAGTGWKEIYGQWPSIFKFTSDNKSNLSTSDKKWWQFWKKE